MKYFDDREGLRSKRRKQLAADMPLSAEPGYERRSGASPRWATLFSFQPSGASTVSRPRATRERTRGRKPLLGGIWSGDLPAPAIRRTRVERESAVTERRGTKVQFLDVIPGALTMLIIALPLLFSFWIPAIPVFLAIALQTYWGFRGLGIIVFGLRGVRRFVEARRTDWYQRYVHDAAGSNDVIPWHEIRHVVVVPNYNEPIETLRKTVEGLVCQREVAERIWVVLAMEAKESGASEKAARLQTEFEGRLGGIFYTLHPSDIPGEVPGKSSNEAWATAWAYDYFVQELGFDIDTITISSCDADSVFHPSYFSCLSYHFSLNPDRYLRIWQAPLFFHNNAWDVPAFIRLVMLFTGISQMAQLSRDWRDNFPISTYSASFTLFHGVGNWDADVIPEDWHMFLKCFFARKGKVVVDPIFLPTTGDAPQAENSFKTAVNRYHQALRHAWGVTDFSYAVKQALRHPEISLFQRLRTIGAVLREHLLWSASWFVLVLGFTLPHVVNPGFFATPLGMFCSRFYGDVMVGASLVAPAFPLLDYLLGPPPPHVKRWLQIPLAVIEWNLLPIITLFLVSLPALHAQARLMFGKDLAYRVTPKAPLASEG